MEPVCIGQYSRHPFMRVRVRIKSLLIIGAVGFSLGIGIGVASNSAITPVLSVPKFDPVPMLDSSAVVVVPRKESSDANGAKSDAITHFITLDVLSRYGGGGADIDKIVMDTATLNTNLSADKSRFPVIQLLVSGVLALYGCCQIWHWRE